MLSLPALSERAAAGCATPLGRSATVSALLGLSALSGPQVFQAFWGLLTGFLGIILSGIGTSFAYVICGPNYSPPDCPGGFAGAIAKMFGTWGSDLGADGYWGPLMLLVSLGAAAAVGLVFLDVLGAERGLVTDEMEL